MKDISGGRGASALVLSGELAEGTSDLSQAMTAPGGIPAIPEVNQDRTHPEAPEIDEQPAASYRRIVNSGRSPAGDAWNTVSPGGREGHMPRPGPATRRATAARAAAQASTRPEDK